MCVPVTLAVLVMDAVDRLRLHSYHCRSIVGRWLQSKRVAPLYLLIFSSLPNISPFLCGHRICVSTARGIHHDLKCLVFYYFGLFSFYAHSSFCAIKALSLFVRERVEYTSLFMRKWVIICSHPIIHGRHHRGHASKFGWCFRTATNWCI